MLLIGVAGLAIWMTGPEQRLRGATYTNRSDFIAACQSLPGIHQELEFWPYLYGKSPGYSDLGDYGHALTVSNVTFSGNIVVFQEGGVSIASEVSLCNFDMNEPLAIHFQNGALAFGADFSNLLWLYDTSNFTATITVAGGGTFSFSCAPEPGSTFFGFTASTPFQDLTYSDGKPVTHTVGGPLHEEMIGDPFMVVMPPPAVLTSLSRRPDGSVRFTLEGNVGTAYLLEASTNLVNWSPLATLVATNGAMPVLDAAAMDFNCRFYRALAQ